MPNDKLVKNIKNNVEDNIYKKTLGYLNPFGIKKMSYLNNNIIKENNKDLE